MVLVGSSISTAAYTLTPHSLRLDHNVPVVTVRGSAHLGFTEALQPRFSWQIGCEGPDGTDTSAACRGATQAAFRVQIKRALEVTKLGQANVDALVRSRRPPEMEPEQDAS